MRQEIIRELRRGIDDVDRELAGIKREILENVDQGEDSESSDGETSAQTTNSEQCLVWFLKGREYDF
jgi:hypothetical protein